jgi:hypothetical protein
MPGTLDGMLHRPTIALVVAALLAIAACQGQTAPTLTDPNAILAAAVRTTAEQKTVRIDATLDGQVAIDLLGSGGAPFDLSGSTASADIDLAGGDARTTFSVSLLTGELIVVDGTSYLKSTLTGTDYIAQPIGDAAPDPSAVPSTILTALTDLLAQPGLDPVKGDDVECGGTTCYTVAIELTPDELAGLGGGLALPTDLPLPIPIPDLSAATVDLTVRVTKDTTRLAGLAAALDLGDSGKLDLDLTFSKWGDPVTISAPPADQVAPAG